MTEPEFNGGSASLARRELWREEMMLFTDRLEWVTDPDLIPARAIDLYPDIPNFSPYRSLSLWMTEQLAVCAERNLKKLSWEKTFSKHGLTSDERVAVRERMQYHSRVAFGPGLGFATDVHSVVPAVSLRQGIGPDSWLERAKQAKQFAYAFNRDHTNLQHLSKIYLYGPFDENWWNNPGLDFDPRLFKPSDETTLTTVTPLAEFIAKVVEVAGRVMSHEDHPGTCPATHVRPVSYDGVTVFDALWDAISSASSRLIYPNLQIDQATVDDQAGPDENLESNLTKIAIAERERLDSMNLKEMLASIGSLGIEIEIAQGF